MFGGLYEHVLDIIFPESTRAKRVRSDQEPLPLSPHLRSIRGRSVTILSPYADKRIEEAICSVKFERSRVAALRLAALLDDYLTEHVAEKQLFGGTPIHIVPVPLGRRRELSRGENQVVLTLRESRFVQDGTLALLECLTRTRETVPQTTLAREARFENIRGAFAVRPNCLKKLRGAHVLLIDDVTTTGATLSEAATNLEQAGAKVECLALAG